MDQVIDDSIYWLEEHERSNEEDWGIDVGLHSRVPQNDNVTTSLNKI